MITRDSGLLVPEHSVPVETIVRDDAKVIRRAMDILIERKVMMLLVCEHCRNAEREGLALTPGTDPVTGEIELTCGCRRLRLERTTA